MRAPMSKEIALFLKSRKDGDRLVDWILNRNHINDSFQIQLGDKITSIRRIGTKSFNK